MRVLSLLVGAAALATAHARGLAADDGSMWPAEPIVYAQKLAEAAPVVAAAPAAAPATAPAAVPAAPVSGKAEGELTVTADAATFDAGAGTLTLAGPSSFVLRTPDGTTSTVSPAAVLAAGGRVNAPQDVLVLGTSADGVPMKAIVRLTGAPTGKEGYLTFPASILKAEEVVALEGGVVQAAKAPGAGPPSLMPAGEAFTLQNPAVIVDGLHAPPPPSTNGEGNDEGNVAGGLIGGGAGYLLCGFYCAIAGGGAGYVFG